MDRAFGRSPGAKDNYVALADLRRNLGGIRPVQDLLIRRARQAGTHSLDSYEGQTYRDLSAAFTARVKAIKAAAVVDTGGQLTHISRRGDAISPARGTGKGRRRR